MKKTGLLFLGILTSMLLNGQTFNIKGGTTISKLDYKLNGYNVVYLDELLIGHSFFLGANYFEKDYFFLSSNIGTIRKGGTDEISTTSVDHPDGNPTGTISEKGTFDYLSLNTSFNLKYSINDMITPFISVGPRLDYLIKHNDEFKELEERDELSSTIYGLNIGCGLIYTISRLQIGFQADYYQNFNKIAEWSSIESENIVGGRLIDKTVVLNLSLGYKIN